MSKIKNQKSSLHKELNNQRTETIQNIKNLGKEYTCKYCGLKRSSMQGKRSHENACPEMKYFADFALSNSYIYTTTWTLSEQADVGGVTTKDERIIRIIKLNKS